jgi:hypothetical protein
MRIAERFQTAARSEFADSASAIARDSLLRQRPTVDTGAPFIPASPGSAPVMLAIDAA